MKKFAMYVILSCCAFGLKAQKIVFPIEVEYDVYLNFGNSTMTQATLAFNTEYANYKCNYGGSNNSENVDNGYTVNIEIPFEKNIFTDRANNLLIEEEIDIDKQMYLIKEQIDTIHWIIADDVKAIDQYTCNKAIGRFRGRNYTAWFTTEIPTYFGPYKIHGLPGLILELADDTGEVMFVAKKINVVNRCFEWIEPNYPQITRLELNNKQKKHLEDRYKRVLSRMDRGVKVSIAKPTIKGIEINE